MIPISEKKHKSLPAAPSGPQNGLDTSIDRPKERGPRSQELARQMYPRGIQWEVQIGNLSVTANHYDCGIHVIANAFYLRRIPIYRCNTTAMGGE